MKIAGDLGPYPRCQADGCKRYLPEDCSASKRFCSKTCQRRTKAWAVKRNPPKVAA